MVKITAYKMNLSKWSSTSTIEKETNDKPKAVQVPSTCYSGEMGSWTIYATGAPMPPFQPNQECVASSSTANNWVKIPVANPGQLVQWELTDQRKPVNLQPTKPNQSREVHAASANFQIQESKRFKPGTIRASPESDQPDQPQLGSPDCPIVIYETPKISSMRKRKLDRCEVSSCSLQPIRGPASTCIQRKKILDAFSTSIVPNNSGESRCIKVLCAAFL